MFAEQATKQQSCSKGKASRPESGAIMGYTEWRRWHDAQTLLNAEDYIREQIRAGTYAGHEPIEDEEQLNQMVRGAKREVEAAHLFYFDNMNNSYDLNSYSVRSEEEEYADADEDEDTRERRGGLLGWLFGR